MASAEDETEALQSGPVYKSPTEKVPEGGLNDTGGEGTGVGLKPRINLFGGVMVIVGCIIGSGIFISPKGVHQNAGSVGLSLIIWVICGVFSAIGAYCYAELGTFITKSGGDYAYVQVAFGNFLAFVRLWIECIIVRPCTMTAVAVTFAVYVLRPFYPYCTPTPPSVQLLAAGVLILLTLINALSVKWVTWVQNVFTVAKLLALLLVILTGLVLLFIGGEYLQSFDDAWVTEGNIDAGTISLAFYSGLWAYNGWNYLNFVTEELENPVRNLPLAILISCSACTVIYVLTNIAFYAGVTPSELVESSAVAVTFADRFYGPMAWIMPVFVAMSCFGTVNGVLLTSSRLFFVAGREQHMPWLLSMINPQRETPIPAVLFTGLLSLLYLFLSDNIYTLINYVQIVNWLAIGIATAGLIYLRRKMPPSSFHRPLQVHMIWPIIFLLGCLFLVIFPIYKAPVDTVIGLSIMASSIPVYLIFIHWRHKLLCLDNLMDAITLAMQKLLLVVPGEKRD